VKKRERWRERREREKGERENRGKGRREKGERENRNEKRGREEFPVSPEVTREQEREEEEN